MTDSACPYRAASTERGWGVVDRERRWCVLDRYAEIGQIRRVEIDYESVCITLSNEFRWVAAVRREPGGPWGAVKLDSWPGEQVLDYCCADEDSVFRRLATQHG